MLVDTPICEFGLKAPDFKLSSFDTTSYTRDELVGAKGLPLHRFGENVRCSSANYEQ